MSGFYNCGCVGSDCDCNQFVGLGSLPPGAIPTGGSSTGSDSTGGWTDAVKGIFTGAWNLLEGWIGIGDGRREADAIVPLQNAVVDRLAQIVAAYPTASLGALQAMYSELSTLGRECQSFVNDPRFTDGRASRQALADVMPLITDNMNKIAARISSLGSVPPVVMYQSPYTNQVYPSIPMSTAGIGEMSTTTLLMLGVGFFLLTKGKF